MLYLGGEAVTAVTADGDSDCDGVPNSTDIDDDNDGVLDTEEGDLDTDQDGIPNRLDTDSDGDTCIDTIEAGTSNDGTTTDANNNGLLDQYEDGSTGTINYTSTYSAYAINDAINACADTDSDGVNDVFDLDDDNDGVLDVNECAVYGSLNPVYGSLNYEFYDSKPSGNTTDNIPTSGALSVGTVDYWNPSTLQNNVDPGDATHYSIRYKGLIDIETAGDYSFYTTSDDGSKLFIDGIEVVDNDGIHGNVTKQGNINLTVGYHTIEVLFFQEGQGSSLDVQYQGPGINKQNLPFSILSSSLPTCVTDDDGDGILNSLDLDSDGDGCSDALEAGATTNTTADYAFTGAVGANGLVDALETTVDSGTINYTSTYNPYAVSDFLAACVDTDSDGVNDLLDIDDDNDGILDATESPSCFYLAGEFENGDRTEFVEVTTTLSMNATYNDLNETVDGVNGTGSADYAVRFTNSQSAIDQTVYQFEFQQAVELSTIYIGYINGNSHFINGASIKLQASNNNANWLDVNDGATYNQANSNSNVPSVGTIRNQAFEVTKNAGVYKYYRIQGVSGTIWDGGYSNEIYFETNNFNASLYPKDNCSVDTDGDGTYNHLDTDSDGDSCIDTIEANAQDDGDYS